MTVLLAGKGDIQAFVEIWPQDLNAWHCNKSVWQRRGGRWDVFCSPSMRALLTAALSLLSTPNPPTPQNNLTRTPLPLHVRPRVIFKNWFALVSEAWSSGCQDRRHRHGMWGPGSRQLLSNNTWREMEGTCGRCTIPFESPCASCRLGDISLGGKGEGCVGGGGVGEGAQLDCSYWGIPIIQTERRVGGGWGGRYFPLLLRSACHLAIVPWRCRATHADRK